MLGDRDHGEDTEQVLSDSYDNALAESVNGLYETELLRREGPWRSVEAVELTTLEWVHWSNSQRLLEPLGYVPPVEFEHAFYTRHAARARAA